MQALVIHHKTVQRHRVLSLITQQQPLTFATVFGAAYSASRARASTAYALVDIEWQHKQISHIELLQAYDNIPNHLSRYYLAAEWSKIIIDTKGFGQDHHLFDIMLLLLDNLNNVSIDLDSLNIYANMIFLWLYGQLDMVNLPYAHYITDYLQFDMHWLNPSLMQIWQDFLQKNGLKWFCHVHVF
jgi:hypothetical protein